MKSFFLAKSKLAQFLEIQARTQACRLTRPNLGDLMQTGARSNIVAARATYLCFKVFSSETVSFFLPFLLREANTLRPFAEAILSRNPCLFFLFLFEGWKVRTIVIYFSLKNEGCKDDQYF